MKKILSILLVLSVALATVFAAPAITGYFGYGYKVNFDGTIEAANYLDSADSSGSDDNAAFLYLKASTDYFSLDVRSDKGSDDGYTDADGKHYSTFGIRDYIMMTGTMKLDKFISDAAGINELPVSLSLMVGNQTFSAKDTWAYTNPYFEDNEIGDIGTRSSFPMGLSLGYKFNNGGSITGNVYLSFADSDEDYLFELLIEPIPGVRVQGAFASENVDGSLQIAALVDVGKLIDADKFSLDVSGIFIMDTWDAFGYGENGIIVNAAVTGGYAGFGAFVEYEYVAIPDMEDDKASFDYESSNLAVGVSYTFNTKYPITLSADYAIYNMGSGGALENTQKLRITAKTVINGATFQLRLGCSDLSSGDAKDWYARFATEIAF